MDRLTKRNSDSSVGINAFRYYNYQDFQKLASKLADYEDLEEKLVGHTGHDFKSWLKNTTSMFDE